MLKKTMLLTAAALAMVAFAVPAVAFAEEGAIYDTKSEITLTEGEEIHFTGTYGFLTQSGSGYDNCAITGNLTQLAGADEVHVHLEAVGGCEQGTGAFSGCQVEEATGTAEGTVTGHDIDLYNVTITSTANSACGAAVGAPGALEHTIYDCPELTLEPTPGSNTSLDSLSLNGSCTWTSAIGNFGITLSGTIGATEEGTWAIETL